MEQMGEQLGYLSEWVQHDDPQIVNRLISSLVKRLVVHPNRTVLVELR